jgi:DNA primase
MQRFTDQQIADARTRWDVVAGEVALKRKGRELAGVCPFHNEKSPSFYVTPDKGFYHCFGCGAHGDVIKFVMDVHGMQFIDAVRHILDLRDVQPREHSGRLEKPVETNRRTEEDIAAIIDRCEPITDKTAAFVYLYLRGVPTNQPGLWYHPALECAELGRDDRGDMRKLPAIVAPLTTSEDKVTAILRTWLLPCVEMAGGTKDNRAPLRVRKKGLGTMGDGAVRLAMPESLFGLAEGWETGCSATALFSLPVWATCGTARFGFPGHWRERRTAKGERARLWFPPDDPPSDDVAGWVDERPPTVWLPREAKRVVIFGDNGETGRVVANYAAAYWRECGIKAFARFPPDQFGDFNDLLLAKLLGQVAA